MEAEVRAILQDRFGAPTADRGLGTRIILDFTDIDVDLIDPWKAASTSPG
jgi:hypothetical protein